MKTVLGIETSCDDTSICLLREGQASDGTPGTPVILAHMSFSQDLSRWGGVVPEVAARNHLMKLAPLLEACFKQAELSPRDCDVIGVTTYPGLLGPLLTGLNAAKTLGLLYKKPIIPVNHLFAHLEAIHLTEKIKYPYLGLLVSGGHSMFFMVKGPNDFDMLGTTIDDAAGEAFDKGGKLMGLDYPAGRIIDELAAQGNPHAYSFPIGLRGKNHGANMSFSGVKTALRVFLEQNPHIADDKNSSEFKDLCASYQYAIISALKLKLKHALGKADIPIVVGGGVACNSALRRTLAEEFKNVFFVKPAYCTDNGAMIANYALRTPELEVPYPECLYLDAKSRYIDKAQMQKLGHS